MLIADHIRAIREAKNLSQGDIEKRCGLKRAARPHGAVSRDTGEVGAGA